MSSSVLIKGMGDRLAIETQSQTPSLNWTGSTCMINFSGIILMHVKLR